jgi:DHA1 family multidrug resistance protein-like MFS transporter
MDFKNGLKAPVYASFALAFASFGDAFLYPFLPLNSIQVGVPIAWIGILLSINRFVRIFSNAIMVNLFSKHGLRLLTIIACITAVISTAGYAFATGALMWLVLRVLWGLSFSALRISTQGYALQHTRKGFVFGLTKGIQELGPMIALFIAPLLLKHLGTTEIFILLAILSLPALYFALSLPKGDDRTPQKTNSYFLQLPTSINRITFTTAFLIDGVIVVVLGILFLKFRNDLTLLTITALVAIYLGYRRICLVIFSPVAGWIAENFGLEKVFNFSLCAALVGLASILVGWIEIGSIIVFTFYSINVAITPGIVSQQNHSLSEIAENSTWRDIGAAVGTLVGGLLVTSRYLTPVLIIATFALLVLLLFHLGTHRRALKLLYLWK